MPKQKLFRRIFLYLLLLSVGGIAMLTWVEARQFRKSYLRQTEDGLRDRAFLLRAALLPLFQPANLAGADSICDLLTASPSRVTLILPDGQVIADSKANPDSMENHKDRPEIREALDGKMGVYSRFSATRNQGMMYVALPVFEQGKLVGVVRISLSLAEITTGIRVIHKRMVIAALFVLMMVILLSHLLSKQIARPISDLETGADRLANGDFGAKLAEGPFEETSRLAHAMNVMAVQLRERFQTILEQKKKQEAVVNSMSEGVIAMDTQMRIMELNPAAAGMLQTTIEAVRGRKAHAIVRNSELQDLIERTLAGEKPVEAEIKWKRPDGECFLQAHGTSIRDETGRPVGGLIVLNDITGIRKLERLRRDFVANVSHELRTPLTSIKGFAETLVQNAQSMNPEDLRHFLSIMVQQADRLNALVDDLLTLSRIEDQEEKRGLQLESVDLSGILLAARDAVLVQANNKGITIEVEAAQGLSVRASPVMIEQAVTNLLDNAIKYSPDASQIRVVGTQEGGLVSISVIDQGIGIESRHIPHLFERFYRVDKARSRKAGGTGLGLSIVKHIMSLHGGRVDVQSVPGKGSTFTLTVPA